VDLVDKATVKFHKNSISIMLMSYQTKLEDSTLDSTRVAPVSTIYTSNALTYIAEDTVKPGTGMRYTQYTLHFGNWFYSHHLGIVIIHCLG
jgi:hypothetical protein